MSRRSREKAAREKVAPPVTNTSTPWSVFGVCTGLAAITLVVFGRTLGHDFIDYDDPVYVRDNPPVAHGLTLDGMRWAFTHVHSSNWHPLTWISHMVDCQLYGLNPAGHHLTNVLLHAATAILLFLLLRRLTGFLWRSAFVAAVFAIHPLRVESVAWVAERKDVLSGLFFVLTLLAYARYAQRRSNAHRAAPGSAPAADSRGMRRDYAVALGFFALALMSKPMVVTLPLVLLLLDYWPLRRFSAAGGGDRLGQLVLEKMPFAALSAAACIVTLAAQHAARLSLDRVSLPLRVGNAVMSYATYIGQMFWPSRLAVLYAFLAKNVRPAEVALSLGLLGGISAAAWILRRQRPYLTAGWLWYLIMLVPVSGIVWVGTQAHADRYTYLPQIGLYIMLTWTAAEFVARWPERRRLVAGGAVVVLGALMVKARTQTGYWRDSETLWTHTLACTAENVIGHDHLGNAFIRKGELDEAMVHYRTAVQLDPNYAQAHYNLGGALLKKEQVDAAIAEYETALQLDPAYVDAHNNLGNALLAKGRVNDAIAEYQSALKWKPDIAIGHVNLGNAFARSGRLNEASTEYREALRLDPAIAEAHYNLGKILLQKGEENEAFTHYQRAIELKPELAGALPHSAP